MKRIRSHTMSSKKNLSSSYSPKKQSMFVINERNLSILFITLLHIKLLNRTALEGLGEAVEHCGCGNQGHYYGT